ncbi:MULTISPECIES: hypothetical protein [Micrococcaceae]|uniref:hypothetical protein n=1 Tax=Micrococcaceae TaxID=1268 RepID=UPI001C4FAF6A|nr:hypothetical protein [Arthrobacter sp. BF1]MDD0858444.1 hypothetical protein [Arthrobacter alpinus]
MSNTEQFDHPQSRDAAEKSIKDRNDASGPENDGPQTVPSTVSQDVESDPALNDGLGQDWADEGGSTPQGPATSSE